MGSNKLHELGTRSSALSCYLSALSHPVRARHSLFTPTVMCSPIVHSSTILFSNSTLILHKGSWVLYFFYGVEVLATLTGPLISQQKYVIDLLSKHNMLNSKPVSTLLVVGTFLIATDGTAPVNATMYCQVVCGLQHLPMTRPYIFFAVNKLSQFMHAPFEHH